MIAANEKSSADGGYSARLSARHRTGKLFERFCFLSTWFALAVLLVLLAGIVWQSWGWLDWGFLTRFDSRHPEQAGIKAGLWGSFWLIAMTAAVAVPVGVGAAIYLEEYAKDNRLTRLIRLNLANLAGVPSIVYGILGLTIFVRQIQWFGTDPWWLAGILPLGRSLLSGALTLSLLILPVVIIAAQEALRGVPGSLRAAAYALGATPWQTVWHQVLPAALPGILTGVILALSRAIGETAPLILVGAAAYIAFAPGGIDTPARIVSDPAALATVPMSEYTVLPLMIFNWVSHPKTEYQHLAAAAILVLLLVLLALNATALYLRHRFQQRIQW